MAALPKEGPMSSSPTLSIVSSYSDISGNSSDVEASDIHDGWLSHPIFDGISHAILSGDAALVRSLAQEGHTVTAENSWVLYEACIRGVEMLQALLLNPDIDLDQEIPGNDGRTLHYLLRTPADQFVGRKGDVIQLLLLSGADPFERDMLGDTALHLLAGPIHRFASPKPLTPGTKRPKQGHEQHLETESLDLLGYILHCMRAHTKFKGSAALINSVNNYGNTALAVAILYNNKEAARLLLEGGADPHIRGELNTRLEVERENVEYTDFDTAQ